jgi:hypothetical protein
MFFRVYHAENPTFRKEQADNFPQGYNHVANVECPQMSDVFRYTNHIDTAWWTNKWVDCLVKSRSTSVGDVIQDTESGDYFVCAPFGWDKIERVKING